MKKGRIISIVLLFVVLGLLFINRDRLVSFAQEDNINMLKQNTVVKNGTTFLFQDYVEFNDFRDNCLYIGYYKEDSSYLTDSQYCVYSSNPSQQIEINNDYSGYWIVSNITRESMGVIFEFMPYDYKAPEYYLDCSPEKITMDTTATCTVTAKTYYSIDNVEFDLSLDDFVIFDEVKLEDVDDFSKEDHHYVLSPKRIEANSHLSYDDGTIPFTEPVTIKLMEFKIKTEKEQDVAVSGNIKLTNLKYDDISGNSTYENLSSTVGQEKKPEAKADNQENKPNPETVDMIVIAAVLFVISAAVILTIKFKKKIS